jgi:hypothetical protein
VEDAAVFLRQSRSGQQPGKLHEYRGDVKLDGWNVCARFLSSREVCGQGEGRATMADVGECVWMDAEGGDGMVGLSSRFVQLVLPKQFNGHGRMKPLAAGEPSTRRAALEHVCTCLDIPHPAHESSSVSSNRRMALLSDRACHHSTNSSWYGARWEPQLKAGFARM